MYVYNVITDTLRELDSAYTDPDTGEIFQAQNIFSWLDNGDIWIYDQEDLALYRLDSANNTLQRVVRLLDEDGNAYLGNTSPSVAPSGTQAVLFDQTTMYLFNEDGSNLRSYPNPLEGGSYVYGYWSEDERFFYISESLTNSATTISFRIFDVGTGEVIESTQNLEGYSFFNSCGTENEWLSYVDTNYEAQLLNIQTGETRNLSLHSEIVGGQLSSVVWMPDCEWLLVSIQPVVGDMITGFGYQAMFIVSHDGQTIYPLGEEVRILSGTSLDHFLLAEAHDTEDVIYEVHFDGTLDRTRINSLMLREFTPMGSWSGPLHGDPYRLVRYDGQTRHIAVMNLRTGTIETYFEPNEVPGSFPAQWLWE